MKAYTGLQYVWHSDASASRDSLVGLRAAARTTLQAVVRKLDRDWLGTLHRTEAFARSCHVE